MISATNGHCIKHAEAEKLSKEVEAFFANGGNVSNPAKPATAFFNGTKKPVTTYTSEYHQASKQRKAIQMPVLNDYAKWGGAGKWSKLSNVVGNKITASQLANANRGETSIKCLENWREVVAAIEILRGEKE